MISPRGETLIGATQVTGAGLHKIVHPDMVIDDQDKSILYGPTFRTTQNHVYGTTSIQYGNGWFCIR